MGLILHFRISMASITRLKQMMALATAWLVLIACNMPFVFPVMRKNITGWGQKNSAFLLLMNQEGPDPATQRHRYNHVAEAMRNLYGRRVRP
ncbi:hypothetical protein ACVXG7_13245 [Enterobacter hormaechei]